MVSEEPAHPQAPWEAALTLWRLLLHVGAGQVAVHQGRLATGQVPHDALEQTHASPMCPARVPVHQATPERWHHQCTR